jgi:ABC-2 type transport system ATP-binding protein
MNHSDPDRPVVEVQHLGKQRGKKLVLDDVSFTLPRGTALGLLGPNGAGKTTAIKILLGMLRADGGLVEVFGKAPMELPPADRRRIGFLSEETGRTGLPDLPVTELLEYHSFFFETWDWDWCRELVQRAGVPTDHRLHAMSEGERRKTELVVNMAHRPEFLILDDPMVGLDARARREILWTMLAAARDEGTTILFTSHVLQDVERLVDHVVILDRGRVRMAGALDELLARMRRLVFPDVNGALAQVPGEVRRGVHGRDVAVVTERFTEGLAEGLRRAHPLLQVENLNLEEIFCTVVADVQSVDAEEIVR